jgi:hypothetical protein
MNEENVVYSHNGILCNHNKEQVTYTCYNANELENTLSERSQLQKATCIYDSIYTKCPEKANPQALKD